MRTEFRAFNREQGSVYILGLLVLLILTVVGLSLSLVTQSEMQIGVNERLSHQAFHMSTAGIDIGAAKALVMPDLRSFQLDLVEPSTITNMNLRHRIEVSPFLPILSAPCNLCQINKGAGFLKVNHAVASTATRIAWMGDPANPPTIPSSLAQQRVSLLVSFQPWRMDIASSVDAATDPNRSGFDNAF